MKSNQTEDPLKLQDLVMWGTVTSMVLADKKSHFVWQFHGVVVGISGEKISVVDSSLKFHKLSRSKLKRLDPDKFRLLVKSGIITIPGLDSEQDCGIIEN